MARKIIDMVRDKKAAIAGNFDAAEEVARLSVAAVKDGIKSRAWESYMLQFVEKDGSGNPLDPAQLSRLLADDDTSGDANLDRKRGYLVVNGMCGSGSPFTEGLDKSVESIDNGLGGEVCDVRDPSVVAITNALALTRAAAGPQKARTRRQPGGAKKRRR